jgi:pantothenate kinase
VDATLKAPSFSHSLKDPVADDVQISSHHRIIVFEGLYANINEGEWARAAALYDERWVVECDEAISRTRLIERHVATGVGKDKEEAAWRGE